MFLKFVVDFFPVFPVLNMLNGKSFSHFRLYFVDKWLSLLFSGESERQNIFSVVLVDNFFRKNHVSIWRSEFLNFLENSGRLFSFNKNDIVLGSSGHLYFDSLNFFVVQNTDGIFSVSIIFVLDISSVEFVIFNFIEFDGKNRTYFRNHFVKFFSCHLFWQIWKENIRIFVYFLILLFRINLNFVSKNRLIVHCFQSLVSSVLVLISNESESSWLSIQQMPHYLHSYDVSICAKDVIKDLFIYFFV